MSIKPILFSTPMIQAILEGRKTQTRRIIKPQPPTWANESGRSFATPEKHLAFRGNSPEYGPAEKWIKPKYWFGDTLWVRETWAPKSISEEPPGDKANYFASDQFAAEKWKPSIHMPKSAARIFLEVTNVRAEKLQEISEEDAMREGCPYGVSGSKPGSAVGIGHFPTLWEMINGEGSWHENPWVWVYEFKQIDKPVNF